MKQKSTIKVGIIQPRCEQQPEKNITSAIEKIKEAADKGAQIVCLPELFRSLYFCNTENYDNFALAEQVPGPTTDRLSQLAAAYDIVIVASLFEKRAEGLYHNTTAVIDAGGEYLGKYRKMHIPDDPGFYEKFYFTPGDLGYKVFQTRYAKIGVLICWDQWYPEAARITSLMGAQMLFYPTAIGWALSQDEETNRLQYEAWQTIQRSHAIANGVHVIAVNRTGIEDELKFWGGSFVANPFGAISYQAPYAAEDVAVVDVDLAQSDYYRTHWPFLRDRRIETYQPITSRFLDDEVK
jgi:N-carbamoylputrescine amidase